jgi:hypothetical protein
MKLASVESDLIGKWQLEKDAIAADETCKRIHWLTNHYLVHVGTDPSGWDDLYRDPQDGRLWERTWPQSEMHGGGPPRLTCLTVDEARKKYKIESR